MGAGRGEAAVGEYRRAIALQPSNVDALSNLGYHQPSGVDQISDVLPGGIRHSSPDSGENG